MNSANWLASGLNRTPEFQTEVKLFDACATMTDKQMGETSPASANDPQTWLMSGIAAEREAEAAAERARVAELQTRIDAVRNFKPTPTAPAKKEKPGFQAFRVTPELLDKHDAMERHARMSQFRASASLDAFDGVRDLITAINNTNF